MSFSKPFHAGGNTALMNLTTASTVMAFAVDGAQPQVMVSNFGAAMAHVEFKSSSAASTYPTTAAAAPGYIIGPNQTRVLTPGTGVTHVAAACSSGTGALYLTPGEGQ